MQELTSEGGVEGDGSHRTISILQPRGTLYRQGPGVVQDFDSLDSEYGWVLCALPHHRPVAVDGEVWSALLAADPTIEDEQRLAALGYAVSRQDSIACVWADSLRVRLSGGQWHDDERVGLPWRWEPTARPSTQSIREKDFWPPTYDPLLRMRLKATLPWAAANELEVTQRRKAALAIYTCQAPIARQSGTIGSGMFGTLPDGSVVRHRRTAEQSSAVRLIMAMRDVPGPGRVCGGGG